ncbi:TonB-dependent receptor domain-containing protein [Massilia sp. erpn]|uniref:TonB-dependent receptor domain-containing protein n=1 Tax=Massilia sp. erpn TaxID=2738142 RepID=UPI002105C4D9|nr:TonB-dependent receptor [Massilia sp. erpn]UTY56484.1 TonB-dependent receptor [Massilia sp. erpn]
MTFPVSRQTAFASLALAIAAPSAFAQNAAHSTVLITASRTPQPASEVLRDALTIGADEILRSGAGSISDLLQRQRGIEITRNGGPGTSGNVFIRGANGNQSLVLVDGVRIGSATTGTASWNAIPLSAIDHIEIVYGPLSTLYGADAIGGVIQIFTKKGKGDVDVTAFVGAGSNATRAADAAISGSSGPVSYSLSAGRERSDGFSASLPGASGYNPDDDGYDRRSAAGQVSLQLAEGHELGANFLYSKVDAQFDNGKSDYDARSKTRISNTSAYLRNRILPNWTSLVQASESSDKSGSFTGVASTTSQIDTKQTGFSWQNDVQLGRDTLQLLYEFRKEEVTSTSAGIAERKRHTRSLAATYGMQRGDHLFSAGARHDDNSQFGNKATGSLGYGYRISPALRANASFGTSFRAPTFNELYYTGYGNENNQPEKGRNGEIGLHYDDGKTQLGAVYYHNKLDDLLVSTTPCPYPGYKYGCAYNVNKAVLKGLSLSAERQFGNLKLSANADFQQPRDDTTGKLLQRRAKRHANLNAEYALGALHAGAELQLSGRRFEDQANRVELGGYSLLNLHATWQFSRDWSALVRWNNVADKKYEVARFYGSAGSTFFAGLRYGMK